MTTILYVDEQPPPPDNDRLTVEIPTAAGATKDMLRRMQREQAEGIAHSMEPIRALEEAGRQAAEREAETRTATVETRDELRRLNARIDDVATGQQRTHRWVVSTTILTAVIVLGTIALVALTVVLLTITE